VPQRFIAKYKQLVIKDIRLRCVCPEKVIFSLEIKKEIDSFAENIIKIVERREIFTKARIVMNGTKRDNISVGALVNVVQKHHQRSGELTEGEVQQILTKSKEHPHGIKVKLVGGIVGRVKEIIEE